MTYNYVKYVDKNTGANVTICVSHFAGKPVRGVARCNPTDKYDEQYGEELARLRCDEKIAMKKINNARNKYNAVVDKMSELTNYMEKYLNYHRDSVNMLNDIQNQIFVLKDFAEHER